GVGRRVHVGCRLDFGRRTIRAPSRGMAGRHANPGDPRWLGARPVDPREVGQGAGRCGRRDRGGPGDEDRRWASRDVFGAELSLRPDPEGLSAFYAVLLPRRPDAGLEARTRKELRLLAWLQYHEVGVRVPRPLGVAPDQG